MENSTRLCRAWGRLQSQKALGPARGKQSRPRGPTKLARRPEALNHKVLAPRASKKQPPKRCGSDEHGQACMPAASWSSRGSFKDGGTPPFLSHPDCGRSTRSGARCRRKRKRRRRNGNGSGHPNTNWVALGSIAAVDRRKSLTGAGAGDAARSVQQAAAPRRRNTQSHGTDQRVGLEAGGLHRQLEIASSGFGIVPGLLPGTAGACRHRGRPGTAAPREDSATAAAGIGTTLGTTPGPPDAMRTEAAAAALGPTWPSCFVILATGRWVVLFQRSLHVTFMLAGAAWRALAG